MCDVMPTISEDSISQRSSQFGDEANFEQLMVSMLDERDKLVESLKNEQEKTSELEQTVKGLEKERDSLNRQLNSNLPQVWETLRIFLLMELFFIFLWFRKFLSPFSFAVFFYQFKIFSRNVLSQWLDRVLPSFKLSVLFFRMKRQILYASVDISVFP